MNKSNRIFSLLIGLAICGASWTANAQQWSRRGDMRGHANNGNVQTYHSQGDHWSYNNNNGNWNHHNNNYAYGRGWNRPNVYYAPVRRSRAFMRPMMMQRPRYIFYSGYNVYFDLLRGLYITYSPMGWSYSNMMPLNMRGVNMNNIPRYQVNYYGDDFAGYYQNQQPVCNQPYNGGW
jgi:hypothetical protein